MTRDQVTEMRQAEAQLGEVREYQSRMVSAARLREVADAMHRLDAFSMTPAGATAQLEQMTARHRASQAAKQAEVETPIAKASEVEVRAIAKAEPVIPMSAIARRAGVGANTDRKVQAVLDELERRTRAMNETIELLSRGRR